MTSKKTRDRRGKDGARQGPAGERRQAERRVQPRVPIDIWVEQSTTSEMYLQRAANLSIGGILLDGSIPHPEGTTVALSFTLPGQFEVLKVRGEVVKALDGHAALGMAIRFVEVDPATRTRIAAFIDQNVRQAVKGAP